MQKSWKTLKATYYHLYRYIIPLLSLIIPTKIFSGAFTNLCYCVYSFILIISKRAPPPPIRSWNTYLKFTPKCQNLRVNKNCVFFVSPREFMQMVVFFANCLLCKCVCVYTDELVVTVHVLHPCLTRRQQ